MTTHIMPVYNPAPLPIDRGEGCWLITTDGERYLDCVAGIATNALGHAHPSLVAALTGQAGKLWHTSNMFAVPGQERLARKICDATFGDLVFFANTGSEAVECALKTARRHHAAAGAPHRVDVIGFRDSFHGRTYAAINAAGNPAYLENFGPRLPGYLQLDLDDVPALEAAIAEPTVAAVIVEPVQGEGGARSLDEAMLRRLRQLCSRHGVLLIYDEVQSGMGRTGRLFAHQWYADCAPDIMAVAKALGGGFPVGACVATTAAAHGMTVGAHGSTFGGNPLAMAVAEAAFDMINTPQLLGHVEQVAGQLTDDLRAIAACYPDIVTEIRGKGLLIGAKLVPNNREFIAAARDERLLVAAGGQNCVRLLPPLILSAGEASEAALRFEETCAKLRKRLAAAA